MEEFFESTYYCIDKSKKGCITKEDIVEAYSGLVAGDPILKATECLKEYKKELTGTVTKQEFVDKFKQEPTKLAVLALFIFIDKDNDGKLSFAEFLSYAKTMGESDDSADGHLKDDFNKMDLDHDGLVSFEEFYGQITQ